MKKGKYSRKKTLGRKSEKKRQTALLVKLKLLETLSYSYQSKDTAHSWFSKTKSGRKFLFSETHKNSL